jgi:hypothetical protein
VEGRLEFGFDEGNKGTAGVVQSHVGVRGFGDKPSLGVFPQGPKGSWGSKD